MILGAICARGGSKGVPRKALREISGRSLIVRAIECGMACNQLERIVVSTDDPEIASAASEAGAEVPFLRPEALARDDTPKWKVFRHLVDYFETKEGVGVDILVDLDVGVPLRIPEDITACIELLENGHSEVVITAFDAQRNPYFNMVEPSGHGLVRIVKDLSSVVHNRQEAPQVFSLSPAVYAIRSLALKKWPHWSRSSMAVHVIPRERAWDVDSETDLKFVEFLLKRGDRG